MHKFGHRSLLLATALSAVVAGCAAPPPEYTVKSNDPTQSIPAIRIAVKKKDQSVVPSLIDDLSSDDPAVRFYANNGLRALTGQDFGYLYYGDEQTRQPAIDSWKAWLAASTKPDSAQSAHTRSASTRDTSTQGTSTRDTGTQGTGKGGPSTGGPSTAGGSSETGAH